MNKEKIININISETPEIHIRTIEDTDTKSIKQNKIEYPFQLYNTIDVSVKTDKRSFIFTIYKGYTWNGADIPRLCWRIIGSRTDNCFLIASMLHDFMLEFKTYIIKEVLKNKISSAEYRRLTSLIFREKIKAQGTPTIKANIMSWCVDVFQIYQFTKIKGI